MKIEYDFEDNQIMNVTCGATINCVAIKAGTLFTWGKG